MNSELIFLPMDAVQITIIVVLLVLTTIITVLSVQVWHILSDLRLTIQKTNKILDDTGTVSELMSQSATGVAGLVSGIKAGMSVLSAFRRKGDSYE